MKKKIQKSEEKTYKKGEVLSMLEQINDGIEVIGEQHKEIVGRLDKVDGHLEKVDGRLDKVEGRLGNVEVRLDKIEGHLGNVEVRLDSLQEDVTEIKHRLSEKVDRADFEKMEKRVIKLEKMVFSKLA